MIIETNHSKQILDITVLVNKELSVQNISNGVCNIFIKHTTAALTTADLDPGTDQDMLDMLEAIIPKIDFRHPHNTDHAPDHILSSIIGPSLTLPIKEGLLDLGTWQRVILVELDGPRTREIVLSIINS